MQVHGSSVRNNFAGRSVDFSKIPQLVLLVNIRVINNVVEIIFYTAHYVYRFYYVVDFYFERGCVLWQRQWYPT